MAEATLTPWLLEKVRDGDAILFLGAGASRGATGRAGEIPLAADGLRDKISDKFLGGQQKGKRLTLIADYAKNEAGFRQVQGYIGSLFEGLYPADFHCLIPTFRWKAIVTTNYDLVVERAYQSVSKRLQELGKLVSDKDDFAGMIKDPHRVPFLKLHGCVDYLNDPEIPLILASEEYARYARNRRRLYQLFGDWALMYPVIFCGHDIADPNIQQILFDLFDAGISRPPYAIVSPGLNEFDLRMRQAQRFVTVQSTFKDFMHYLDSEIPGYKRRLSMLVEKTSLSIGSYIAVESKPSDELARYLSSELEHVHAGIPAAATRAEDYYRGKNDSWSPYIQQLDVRRRVTDDILLDPILEESRQPVRSVLLKGYAGSGKSAVLRRAAWEATTDYNRRVFWLREGGLIRPQLVAELYRLLKCRVSIFAENAVREMAEIASLIALARREALEVNIILAARTNEWNVYGGDLAGMMDREYEMRNLSQVEIDRLLEKLERSHCLGALKTKTREERHKYFALTADRQLLVALHEATGGKPLEEIVEDEYRNITPKEARVLYLDICTLNRLRVGVRAGLINRVSGIAFERFKQDLFAPLEHVVRTVFDWRDRDYHYLTRHPAIADIVFTRALPGQAERAEQIARIIRCMNTDYDSDQQSFGHIIKGRTIAEMFVDRAFAEQVFKAALESTASEMHVEHQRAVFELNHPNGDLNKARQAVRKAEEASGEASNRAISHTKAMLLRALASKASGSLEKQKLWDDTRVILDDLVRRAMSAHPFSTLAEVNIDEIRYRISMDDPALSGSKELQERLIADLIRGTEETLRNGLDRFPDDEYLLAAEAKLATLLKDEDRALGVLKGAVEKNPHSAYLAIALSRSLVARGESGKAREVLETCLKANPGAKDTHFELAMRLMDAGEETNHELIDRHLRASFTDGDNRTLAQYWAARHNILYGDRQRGQDLFRALRNTRLSPAARTSVKGQVEGSSGGLKVFHGVVVKLFDTCCFVHCTELGVDVYIHFSQFSEGDWDDLSVQSRLVFNIAFNMWGPVGISPTRAT